MARIAITHRSQRHASAGFNTSHVPGAGRQFEEETVAFDRSQMAIAAAALREAEIGAQDPLPVAVGRDKDKLDEMNIDELRAVAKRLGVPDRETIVEKDELVAAIARRL